MITARLGTEKDIDRIVEIQTTIGDGCPFTPDYVKDRLLRKDCVVSVGLDNNKVIGFGFDEIGSTPNVVTHYMLDPKWSNLNPLNQITALKAIALVWVKYTVTLGETTKTQYTIAPGTHLLTRSFAPSWMGFSKVGTDQNNSEIYEATFTDHSLLDTNPGVVK